MQAERFVTDFGMIGAAIGNGLLAMGEVAGFSGATTAGVIEQAASMYHRGDGSSHSEAGGVVSAA